MSDLHDLSAPIEESREEISKKEVKTKQIEKAKVKENLKKLFKSFRKRYQKKILLSFGIAVTVCVILIFVLSKVFFSSTNNIPENTRDTSKEETPINQEASTKYTKFDGHQYYFYFPEDYGFLNRTRNDDLNEVVFSFKEGGTAFTLQEFEADNNNERTLDSIYSYISTTLPPTENKEIKIGENTFKQRVYKECKPKTQEELDAEAKIGETYPISVTCALGDIYYSIYINGIVVIFSDLNLPDHMDDQSVLETFAKNITDSQILTDEYISARLPTVKNKLQAHYAFGIPSNVETKNNITEISWQTTGNLKILLGFKSSKALVYSHGAYGDRFKFDFNSGISNSVAKTAYENLMANQGVQNGILRTNPDIHFYMDDSIPNNNFWEIKILSSGDDDAILIAEYTIDKTTGKVGSTAD